MGMAEDIDESVWSVLISDMAADAKRQLDDEGITDENHPRMKAYRALLSVSDQYRDNDQKKDVRTGSKKP
ncbi:MAG: hypothetical protein K6E49_01405 [Lachnospiraceae bacterium]|nr:hypothetical protein [Lachnospiraceae bacterium]